MPRGITRTSATPELRDFFTEATVPRGGFTWVPGHQLGERGHEPEGRFLVRVSDATSRPDDQLGTDDKVLPLARKDLEATLHRCQLDEEGVRRVADRFGFLSRPVGVVLRDQSPPVPGESLAAWASALRRYRTLCDLAVCVTEGNILVLVPHVSWAADGSSVRVSVAGTDDGLALRGSSRAPNPPNALPPDGAWTCTWVLGDEGRPVVGVAADQLARWRRSPVLAPVRAFVAGQVDASLRDCVHVRLVADARRPDVLATRFQVDHLLGVAFVRLHLRVAGHVLTGREKRCEWPGCTARIAAGRHYCDDHRPEADRERKRRYWRNHPEHNERRRSGGKAAD